MLRTKLLVGTAVALAAAIAVQNFGPSVYVAAEARYRQWKADQEHQQAAKEEQQEQKIVNAQTTKLPRVDSAVVCVLGEDDESPNSFPIWPDKRNLEILSQAELRGARAEDLAKLWRSREFGKDFVMCHDPIYGLRFYSQGKLLLETSLCWNCFNCYVQLGPQSYRFIAFGDENDSLLNYLQSVAPLPLPTQAILALKAADTHIASGEYPQAQQAIDEALQLDPKTASANYTQGKLYDFCGEYSRAIEAYSKAIDKLPEFGRAYWNRGEVKAKQGDQPGAIEDYTLALKYGTDDGVLEDRGLAYAQLGNADKALADFSRVMGKAAGEYYVLYLRQRAAEMAANSPPERLRIMAQARIKLYADAASKLEQALKTRKPAGPISPDGRFVLLTAAGGKQDAEVMLIVQTVDGREIWRGKTEVSTNSPWLVAWGKDNRIWLGTGDATLLANWVQMSRNKWDRAPETIEDAINAPEEVKQFAWQ
ncbi:MAG TPA: tetratricopeptide repeat protein [Pirellulales bacterium]|jgi:tetratricopeptide (TPR) repeat protein|nr:tetratricopeptide repeat protein [Pirellulales bacterium]